MRFSRRLDKPQGSTAGETHAGRSTAPRGRRRRALRGDGGSATVWVLGLAAMIWLVAAASAVAGHVRTVRHQAGVAADMAALAAAGDAFATRSAACAEARRVARANGAGVVACTVHGGIADVTVRSPLPQPFGSLTEREGVIMRARAGPAGRSPDAAAAAPGAAAGPAAGEGRTP